MHDAFGLGGRGQVFGRPILCKIKSILQDTVCPASRELRFLRDEFFVSSCMLHTANG